MDNVSEVLGMIRSFLAQNEWEYDYRVREENCEHVFLLPLKTQFENLTIAISLYSDVEMLRILCRPEYVLDGVYYPGIYKAMNEFNKKSALVVGSVDNDNRIYFNFGCYVKNLAFSMAAFEEEFNAVTDLADKLTAQIMHKAVVYSRPTGWRRLCRLFH